MDTALVERRPLVWILPLSAAHRRLSDLADLSEDDAGGGAGWIGVLPAANACFNSLSAAALAAGYVNIKRGNRQAHMRCMLAAVAFSALFLVSYVVYHDFHGDTRFPGQGLIRPIYFFILVSHIGLSIVALPMILIDALLRRHEPLRLPSTDRALHAADLVLRVGDGRGGVRVAARVRLTLSDSSRARTRRWRTRSCPCPRPSPRSRCATGRSNRTSRRRSDSSSRRA